MKLTAEEVQQIIRTGVPAAEDKDLRILEIGQNSAIAMYPFNSQMIRPGGTLSGPTIMGLADAAMYAAILGRYGAEEMAVTSQMTINFLRKPAARDLRAESVILKAGKRSVFLEVRLFSEGETELVALVTGSYALPAPK